MLKHDHAVSCTIVNFMHDMISWICCIHAGKLDIMQLHACYD